VVVTAKAKRLAAVLLLSAGVGVVGVGVATYLTWPENSFGVFLHRRQLHRQNVRALEHRIAVESDTATRTFYQAWLEEENGDLAAAIQGFQAARDGARPGTQLHLNSSLRLGRAYGMDGESDRELAIYQGMMARYPGPSRVAQALFCLRRGERGAARLLLDQALERDARDGSLGPSRTLARSLRQGMANRPEEAPAGIH
jgi:hypothetical protein